MGFLGHEFIQQVREFSDQMVEYTSKHLELVNGLPKALDLRTSEEVLAYVGEHRITSIRLWFTDVLGFLKTFEITPAELAGAFEEGMGFDGSSIHGYQRIQESDMVALPLARTAQFIPFQIGPSRCIRMYAEITDHFLIFNPQYSGPNTVRLFDLGEEEYFKNVPYTKGEELYKTVFEKMDEIHPQHGRPYRDIHNVWQWGIVDDDLRRVMKEVGFDQVHFEDCGRFPGLEKMVNRAFVFKKSDT